jgi:ubiquinone/menaquinone biosynthesis C-methylase UbiE
MTSTPADVELQKAWDPDPLRQTWPMGRDVKAFFERIFHVAIWLTADGATGPVLEVAAAEAAHSCRLAQQGLECFVVEPSPGMLLRAREQADAAGVRLRLVRGIGEALPFPPRTFDRVLCDSALDHFASPDVGVREMTRVLRPEGRMVISFVNYGSLSVRLSRLLYGLDRIRAPETAEQLRFWDSPVPQEHTFEGTYRNVLALCGQYLELERAVGVSMLYGTPGWSAFLERLPERQALRVVHNLDRAARRLPALADMVFTVWRPRRDDDAPGIGVAMLPRLARLGAPAPAAPPRHLATMRSGPADPIYRAQAAEAAARAAAWRDNPVLTERWSAAQPFENLALTGDRERSWIDDLMARGPFRHAALVGQSPWATVWLRQQGSQRLDVIDASKVDLGVLRHRLAPWLHRVRLVHADPNFVTFAPAAYDVVWSDDALGHVVNLEYLLDEIARALRPGGLFAFHGYVGEPRQQFAAERLAYVNAALRLVPSRYRHDGLETIGPTPLNFLGPFRAARSPDVLPLATARFEVVHQAWAGALFPLPLFLDLPALAREEPEVVAQLEALEAEARRDPAVQPALAYAVLRKPA